MMEGATVAVVRRVRKGTDCFKMAVYADETEEVADCLVMPTDAQSLGEERPEGVTTAYRLCFPQTYTDSLRGCAVLIDGEAFEVVGDPRPIPHNCPTRWNRIVEVTRTDG